MGVTSSIVTFAMFPIISALASHRGLDVVVWAAVGLQLFSGILAGLSYGNHTMTMP